jgi:hypothetical protein
MLSGDDYNHLTAGRCDDLEQRLRLLDPLMHQALCFFRSLPHELEEARLALVLQLVAHWNETLLARPCFSRRTSTR